jgi:hypothetical protein
MSIFEKTSDPATLIACCLLDKDGWVVIYLYSKPLGCAEDCRREIQCYKEGVSRIGNYYGICWHQGLAWKGAEGGPGAGTKAWPGREAC